MCIRDRSRKHKTSRLDGKSSPDCSPKSSDEDKDESMQDEDWEEEKETKPPKLEAQNSPRTPEPNKHNTEILKQRLAETPLNKNMINIPQYVYNSDDDFLA
eukprot:TRINITY_DN16003_c0_g1_i4.p3 TRINITY_DN16003_c0_g1~~TRINITY_DN16003_c0_g1_i4.p3  ORF type:complete len:101 (+),score=30.77 TRINITY_DN16003_c0_g1_i4:71-373(+)